MIKATHTQHPQRLAGKVAIVTGGATGIGEAVSKKFALHGARVIVAGHTTDPVEEVVAEIRAMGLEATGCVADLSEPSQAQGCVQRALDAYGQIDILINNAGVYPDVANLVDFEDEAHYKMVRNNIHTAYFMTKYCIPHLAKTYGNIVMAGSEAGAMGDPMTASYAGTKGYIHAFTKSLAVELGERGIRVNAVLPGPIDTSWTHRQTGPMPREMEKMIVAATPMGRRGTTEEVANVYLFLASDEASYVTGSLYACDGGIMLGRGTPGQKAHGHFKEAPKGELELKHQHDGDPYATGKQD